MIKIVGDVDENRLFCAGSFTKLMTTFVSLSVLAESYSLNKILDDDTFFDSLCVNAPAKNFLKLFQQIIGSRFSLHDICSYFTGLPYTFDVYDDELDRVDQGYPFKHHSLLSEEIFLQLCKTKITPVYKNQNKFHYSEISIIFLGYLLEKVYDLKMEDLYQRYVMGQFNLTDSLFSRRRVEKLFCQDLSDQYDYPSIAILDHGYFCYSNGFFTTLKEMKILLENLLNNAIFQFMVNLDNARAASPTLMNGLAVEIRQVDDDILYGYEGLSFSGCNIWAYSTKHQQGYLTFTNDEEKAYDIYELFGYSSFSKVPEYTSQIYKNFLKNNQEKIEKKAIPTEYQGHYQRVNINEKSLEIVFTVGDHFIIIRNPDMIQYNVIYVNGHYHVQGKDKLPGSHVGLVTSQQGHLYMYYDGTLYKKFSDFTTL